MTARDDKPLSQYAAESAKRARDQLAQDFAEVLAKEPPPPPQFSPAIARLKPRTAPSSTLELAEETLHRLLADRRCWITDGVLHFAGGTLRQNVPITTPQQVVTLCRVLLNATCTIDFATTILTMTKE